MKKKNIKPLIISALLAVGFGATSVGTTFALFTDSASTSINVTAGKVDISSAVENLITYSAKADRSGSVLDENQNKYILENQANNTFSNGGNVTVNESKSIISVNKMTPGDGLKFDLETKYNSNVNTKFRFKYFIDGEDLMLASVIETKIVNTTTSINVDEVGLRNFVTEWYDLAGSDNESAIGNFSFELYLPLTTNGKEYEDKNFNIYLTLEAVQGNAQVENESQISTLEGLKGYISNTQEVDFLQLNGLWLLKNDVTTPVLSRSTRLTNSEFMLDLNGHDLTVPNSGNFYNGIRSSKVVFTNSSENRATIYDHSKSSYPFIKSEIGTTEMEISHLNIIRDSGSGFTASSSNMEKLTIEDVSMSGITTYTGIATFAENFEAHIKNFSMDSSSGCLNIGKQNTQANVTMENVSLKGNSSAFTLINCNASIEHLNVEASGSNAFVVQGGGEVDVSDFSISSKGQTMWLYNLPQADIELKNGSISSTNDDGIYIDSDDVQYVKMDLDNVNITAAKNAVAAPINIDLTVNNSIIESTGDGYGLYTNGSSSAEANLCLTNTKVFSQTIAMYIAACETLTIDGGEYRGKTSGVEIRSGLVLIKGDAKFICHNVPTDNYQYSVNANGSGTTTTGAALAFAQHDRGGLAPDLNVTLKSCTVTGLVGVSFANPQNNTTNNVSLSIESVAYKDCQSNLENSDSRIVI